MYDLKFDSNGLIPAIVQDYKTNEVLTLAYMNKESFQKTLESGQTWFYSRSRQKLWHKGETSGHFQNVKEIFADCDQDALVIKVEQIGVACHTGAKSCFFERIK
jgi:phosphoribosyl-ATP pyrophosphohydrolase/phosphoribosyl-AMP cyclohydrolase